MLNKRILKETGKVSILFILYILFACAAIYPGYFSPVYRMLFPVVAAFLMTGPLTVLMSMNREIGSTLLFPMLFFIIAKLSGEMKFACVWIPYLVIIILAEAARNLAGIHELAGIRIAVPIVMLCMAVWNNGFYFGGQAYMKAVIDDMGTEYIAVAAKMSTPFTYVIVIAGVIIASVISERLTEKIAGIEYCFFDDGNENDARFCRIS